MTYLGSSPLDLWNGAAMKVTTIALVENSRSIPGVWYLTSRGGQVSNFKIYQQTGRTSIYADRCDASMFFSQHFPVRARFPVLSNPKLTLMAVVCSQDTMIKTPTFRGHYLPSCIKSPSLPQADGAWMTDSIGSRSAKFVPIVSSPPVTGFAPASAA